MQLERWVMADRRDWQHYTDLLHDARLQDVAWDPTLGRVAIEFQCLRRHPDGSPLADPVVQFLLTGVAAVAVGYESSLLPGPRPSAYDLQRRISGHDLQYWPFQAQEAYFTVNSPAALDEALHAPISEWLLGSPDDLDRCPLRIGLGFSSSGMLGMPPNTLTLVIGCDSFETLSNGVPLELDTWSEQFAAWWQGWRQHWDAKGKDDGAEPSSEDTFIPAGESPPPDRTYRPPQEPAVAWEATDAPAELLRPLTEWFEGHMREDWLQVAHAEAHFDYSATEWAAKLAARTEYDHGRWQYARQVDEWWIEGIHAEVAVRGVEHTMPFDDEPARNVETVWNFRLRRREGRWTIHTYSQGWPPYGSAPAKTPEQKPWLTLWQSGTVKTRRDD